MSRKPGQAVTMASGVMDPLLGFLEFDLFGNTAYVYCLSVLLVVFLAARTVIRSSFGQSLRGIRENEQRMFAIGSAVYGQTLRIYTISAVMAGIAGALLAQTTEFVALDVLSFERSGDVLIMLILGGTGRLYGAFVGAPIYMILQDQLAKLSPEYWLFGIGILLIMTVLYAPEGLLGVTERCGNRIWRGTS
jgi:branched-chain amino acid transport system permease protein